MYCRICLRKLYCLNTICLIITFTTCIILISLVFIFAYTSKFGCSFKMEKVTAGKLFSFFGFTSFIVQYGFMNLLNRSNIVRSSGCNSWAQCNWWICVILKMFSKYYKSSTLFEHLKSLLYDLRLWIYPDMREYK